MFPKNRFSINKKTQTFLYRVLKEVDGGTRFDFFFQILISFTKTLKTKRLTTNDGPSVLFLSVFGFTLHNNRIDDDVQTSEISGLSDILLKIGFLQTLKHFIG